VNVNFEMIRKIGMFVAIMSYSSYNFAQGERAYQLETVAFYNLENFFDTVDDPNTFDDDRTANGKDRWDDKRFQRKLENISKVLSEIGTGMNTNPPAVIGLCEVENRTVLDRLVAMPALSAYQYAYIHFDSPDERGVDVALLYRKAAFRPLQSKNHKLLIFEADQPGKRDYTRDQLVVSGLLHGEEISFIVNHWPSRGGGELKSSYKREKAAALNRRIIDSLRKEHIDARIIAMGDFNDDPTDKSFKKILQTKSSKENLKPDELYNPMELMLKNGKGSLAYRDSWNLFDQFYMSGNLVNSQHEGFQFYKAEIFTAPYLITQSGQFRGYPYRTYGYSGYEGGYSDHFPVYLYLIRNSSE